MAESADIGQIQLLRTRSDNKNRLSYLYTPSSYQEDKPTPLVMAFHGYLGSADQMMRMTSFNGLAEKEGFLVLYPESFREKWNANLGPSESSEIDVNYIKNLLNRVKTFRNIDPNRIYATGFSSGGFFSQRLACEMSDDIAAIAPVAATTGIPLMHNCKLKRPIAFLGINGTHDPIITWDGHIRTVRYAFRDASIVSVPSTIRFWQLMNACQKLSIKSKKNPKQTKSKTDLLFTQNQYHDCRDDMDVEQIIIFNGGHTWPGSRVNFKFAKHVLGYTSQDLSATETIWEFFKAHPMPKKYQKSDS